MHTERKSPQRHIHLARYYKLSRALCLIGWASNLCCMGWDLVAKATVGNLPVPVLFSQCDIVYLMSYFKEHFNHWESFFSHNIYIYLFQMAAGLAIMLPQKSTHHLQWKLTIYWTLDSVMDLTYAYCTSVYDKQPNKTLLLSESWQNK